MDVVELNERVKNTKGIVLYFKNDKCSPCIALRPKIEKLINDEFRNMDFVIVDTIENPLLSSEYKVFSNPIVLVFFEGKEYIRKNLNVSIMELESEIQRLYKLVY